MRVIVFNVYPYRERLEKRQKWRVGLQLGLAVGLAFVVALAVYMDFNARLDRQAKYLSELSTVEAEIASRVARVRTMKEEAQRLRRQVAALESVEQESLQASQVMSYLDQSLPRSVGLNRMKLADSVLVINGLAESVPQLARWVEGMETNTALFKGVDLVFLRDATPLPGDTSPVEGFDRAPHQFEIKLVLLGAGPDTHRVEVADAATR